MKFKRAIMWVSLFSIGLLAVLSAVESFFGAEYAKVFFNSTPLVIYWSCMALLLAAGLVAFPRLLRKPGLLMMHAGCLLIVAGSMLSSRAGHRLSESLLGIKKIPAGYMLIHEGSIESHVTADNPQQVLGELPFSIKLNDFRIEYYPAGPDSAPTLYIRTQEGATLQLHALPGRTISLGKDKGLLTVVRTFKNFKMQLEGGEKKAMDAEGDANPAVEVKIASPDGSSYSSYAFEKFKHPQKDGLEMAYVSAKRPPTIRSFLSDLTVIENGQETAHKTIAVNDPLHYGGYHFYQHSYDSEAGRYSVLSVTSDSGLYIVYGGYFMLCLGALWHFWLAAAIRYFKQEKS